MVEFARPFTVAETFVVDVVWIVVGVARLCANVAAFQADNARRHAFDLLEEHSEMSENIRFKLSEILYTF